MKTLILLISFIVMSNYSWATNFNVVTGYGYISDSNGHIINKAEYPTGTVNLKDGLTYTEVANQAALEAITVYVTPTSPSDAFNVDIFVQQLSAAYGTDTNVLPYYAVIKDLATYKNFTGIKNMVALLLSSGKLTQAEIDILNTILANQNIILANF